MTNLKDILNNIKQNSYTVIPFQVMGEAATYYKKTFLLVITALMTSFLAYAIIGSMILSKLMNFSQDQEVLQQQMVELLNMIAEPPYFYYYLLFAAVSNALGNVLIAGFYKMNADVSLNKVPSIGSAFKYFFNKKGVYVFIIQLIISLIFMGITVPLKLMNLEMVSMAINCIANILTIFTIPLIIFGNQNPFTALKNSIMVVNKQPIPIILIVVLNYFFLISGLFLFIIGILFVLPYLFAVYFVLYKQVIGYNLEEEKELA
ncbi:hypothetical protein HX017_14650 [Myroides marinus]|uniref:hypothetical protein n=1 Tax=Myroides marinus TaxID=703342 RepID=UPI0007424BC6|nr:hypothetical protein [Myroides marinus]KUF40337.1 hypothetical protein AS361_17115 [Myroides marinus]MDM1347599.1 hypothetical protein [Myroides marinus]MDM1350654.1 hypothetical protein [Myroides marinus]MDM1354374.1 hypothetical protein [Myroides marinus]MDM1357861.1 hypothetical protein [Myroides marinus]